MLIERLFSTWAERFYRNNPGDFAPSLLSRPTVEKFGMAFDTFAKEHPSGALFCLLLATFTVLRG